MNDKTCERCGETLDDATAVELETDGTGRYFAKGSLAPDKVTDIGHFGKACARHVLNNNGAVFAIGKRAPANRPRRHKK